ncbi:hypothetical protein ACWGJB_46725 [Streptomyces sp. NPDC054813]
MSRPPRIGFQATDMPGRTIWCPDVEVAQAFVGDQHARAMPV